MSDVITTLHRKDDPSVNIYPNVKADNIPSEIMRIADLGTYVNQLTSINITGDIDAVSMKSDVGTFDTADVGTLNVSGVSSFEGTATFGSDVEVDGNVTLNSPESILFKTGSLDFSELTNFIATYNKEAYQFKYAGLNVEACEEETPGTSSGFNPVYSLPNIVNATNIEGIFENTTISYRWETEDKIVMPSFNNVVTTSFAFKNTNVEEIEFTAPSTIRLTYAFFPNAYVKRITTSDTEGGVVVANVVQAFSGCTALEEIGYFNMAGAGSTVQTFRNCSALKSIHCLHWKGSFDISASTQFEEADLVEIIGNLDTVSTAQTLTMGSTNLAKLTEDEILVATGKGWTLA